VYQVEASKALLRPRTWVPRAGRLSVPRNVVLLGTVSMLTDISAEMVATVLPLYLVFSLGVTPLALGAIDGLYRGAAAIVQVGGGFASDRLGRHKEVATLGYGLSALAKGSSSPAARLAESVPSSPATGSGRESAPHPVTL
jgi:hypothetical protein